MIVIVNCKITDIRFTSFKRGFLGIDNRFDIARYTFASLVPLLPLISHISFNLSITDGFKDKRQEMEDWLVKLFPKEKLTMNWERADNIKQWRDIVNALPNNDDALIFPVLNDDHVFIDSNIDVMQRGLELISQDPDPHAVLQYSHYTESLRYSIGYNPQLSDCGHFVSYNNFSSDDSIRILKREFFDWYLNLVPDGYEASLRQLEDWTILTSGAQKAKNKMYVPTKEQFRHYDSYSHVNLAIDPASPLVIPPGFFEDGITIRYGYDDYDPNAVNINPTIATLRCVDSVNGTDYKITLEDLPAFWKPFIKNIDVCPTIDNNKASASRDQYCIDLANASLNSYYGHYDQSNQIPEYWIYNHLISGEFGLSGGLSFLILMEQDRYDVFKPTYEKYVELLPPTIRYEFLLITRTMDKCDLPNTRIVRYESNKKFFNTTKGLNIGIREAQYKNVVLTCPEIIPTTDIIRQITALPRSNYICQVFDQNEDGTVGPSLVNTNFRGHIPMYFLGFFKKEDIEKINGWDEDFMDGFAWEDVDFGERFVRAGLPFKVLDDVQALHKWHPRNYHNEGWNVNFEVLMRNNQNGITYCKNGLVK